MIDKFIPQPWPMWAVIEDLTGNLTPGWSLVIGWTPDPDDDHGNRLTAVLTDNVTGTAAPYLHNHGNAVLHLFTNADEAADLYSELRRGDAR